MGLGINLICYMGRTIYLYNYNNKSSHFNAIAFFVAFLSLKTFFINFGLFSYVTINYFFKPSTTRTTYQLIGA